MSNNLLFSTGVLSLSLVTSSPILGNGQVTSEKKWTRVTIKKRGRCNRMDGRINEIASEKVEDLTEDRTRDDQVK